MIRVLLIDDHALVRAGIVGLLAGQDDIEVVAEAGDGLGGATLARELQPDVALVDLAMPGMSGFELTRKLLANAPALHVIAVSGLSHEGDASKALDAGATSFLMKGGLYSEVGDAIVDAAATAH